MADPVAAASQFSGDFPAWVLLEPFASLGECRNHTTATSLTSFNRPIELSFELVDPPKVSRWFVRLVGRKKQRGFYGKPFILNSSGSGSLVVLRMAFYRPDEGRILDYFVYKAGPGKPSLDLIPGPCPAVNFPKLIGILPSDDDGHYSVIFPVAKFRHDPRYKILVFSSVDQSWSTKFASICPDSKTVYRDAVMHHPSTAIAVGQGSLAWIDVWLGVLVCDRLNEDNPVLRLIPWPCNNPMDVYSPDASRGAALSDGTIRFVQAKFHYSFCCHSGDVIPIGWTATMWKRRRGLEEREWEMCFEVDIAKILTNHSSSSDLLQKLWDTESNKLDLNKVSSSVPILSLTNEDILYLKMNLLSNEALLIAVNVRKNKLEAVQQTSFEFVCSPCSFSSLFDASSGIETANQLDEDECKNRDNLQCVGTYLQAALDELKDIEEHLELRKPWYNRIAPLCSDDGSSSSSLPHVIEAVAPYASVNVHNNSMPDAVNLLVECFRVLGDLKSRILAPLEETKNKISIALVALDMLRNGHTSNNEKVGNAEDGFK